MNKEQLLQNLKEQMKIVVQVQYETEPNKVKGADVEKSANGVFFNSVAQLVFKATDIKLEDIVKLLTEIKDEVCSESS